MLAIRIFVVLACVALGCDQSSAVPNRGGLSGPAVDLTQIKRTVDKEPSYQNKPRYCLLVLGLRAETRIWLVVDGNDLYVDRNADGDLTDEGEKVTATKPSAELLEFEAGEIVEADGKTKHARLVVTQYFQRRFGHLVEGLFVSDVRGNFGQGTHSEKGMQFAESLEDAPIVHIGGPFTMTVDSVVAETKRGTRLLEFPFELQPGEQVADIHVLVGTPGLGQGTFAAISSQKSFPKDVHPTVEMELPSKADADRRVRATFTLTKRC
jgi:hypothetical protein